MNAVGPLEVLCVLAVFFVPPFFIAFYINMRRARIRQILEQDDAPGVRKPDAD